ncbi:hypothetical protein [Arundinibacter roseus]|uniref:Uncharacterized protein n=1 Tax=Arundinibacter roseus TaxID=2070510 RepID=A0A4R4KKK3_9BACT|nr:hypothetical protein [Arundinibacter roseus]TDB67502.1 hypothetical protein EZE20_06035 [Arundinibacter roseus]
MLKTRCLQATLIITLLIVCMSCQDKDARPVVNDSAYFPLEVGNFWIYQVTTESFAAANLPVKQTFQVQQKISSSFARNGEMVFVLDESFRPNADSPWKLTSIRTVQKNRLEVIEQNDNAPVVPLTFPIDLTTFWDKNRYNTSSEKLLNYQDVARPFAVENLDFANTVTVSGSNDSTLVGQEKYLRVYAPGIGCVYREDRSLTFCQQSPTCIGKGKIESGSIERWVLISSVQMP